MTVVPANAAPWRDLQTVLGGRGQGSRCQCQRYKLRSKEAFNSFPVEERAHRLRSQTNADHPDSRDTSGLVAYLDDEPVGWAAVEPRTAYPGLRHSPVPWANRTEDPDDSGVWAVTCLFTRPGYRKRGISRALLRCCVDFARERGARAVEGYPMVTPRAVEEELHVGVASVFVATGFTEVSHPTVRRAVMRIDFA